MPTLKRLSGRVVEWTPVVRHGEGFHPPQYIQDEIDGIHNRGKAVNVICDGDRSTFYRSRFANAGRVSFEITEAKDRRLGLGVVPGWHYISDGGNDENLNLTLDAGMEFELIP